MKMSRNFIENSHPLIYPWQKIFLLDPSDLSMAGKSITSWAAWARDRNFGFFGATAFATCMTASLWVPPRPRPPQLWAKLAPVLRRPRTWVSSAVRRRATTVTKIPVVNCDSLEGEEERSMHPIADGRKIYFWAHCTKSCRMDTTSQYRSTSRLPAWKKSSEAIDVCILILVYSNCDSLNNFHLLKDLKNFLIIYFDRI